MGDHLISLHRGIDWHSTAGKFSSEWQTWKVTLQPWAWQMSLADIFSHGTFLGFLGGSPWELWAAFPVVWDKCFLQVDQFSLWFFRGLLHGDSCLLLSLLPSCGPLGLGPVWLPGGLVVKNLPAMQETWVWLLGWEDTLEKEMATHSSILAWEVPGTEKPDGLQSMGSQRVLPRPSD